MADETPTPDQTPENTENVEIEALSDEALEDVSGGVTGKLCSYVGCSNA
jgi:hypothetical protein